MKRIILIIAIISLANFAHGQIIFENTYNFSGTYTRLANSGYKFFIMDVGTSQCRIFNTNHTLWKTINLAVPVGNYLYDVKFVSENLFMNDNSICLAYIYYSYNTTGQYYTYTAKIMKENGTELLTIPGCQYLTVQNLTDVGTKMIAYCYDYSLSPYTIQTKVYNLPGQLVYAPGDEDFSEPELAFAFPNPANAFTTIPYELPSGIASAELTLTDSQGIILRSWIVDRNAGQITIPTAQFPRGIYFYSLHSWGFQSNNHKLVIQ